MGDFSLYDDQKKREQQLVWLLQYKLKLFMFNRRRDHLHDDHGCHHHF
jgi:hypothetical protein